MLVTVTGHILKALSLSGVFESFEQCNLCLKVQREWVEPGIWNMQRMSFLYCIFFLTILDVQYEGYTKVSFITRSTLSWHKFSSSFYLGFNFNTFVLKNIFLKYSSNRDMS